ncbi:hypothetical protein SteCoe_26201 [Stentor coeruleus]|uniref:Reelin domain-containing protein n=1 Tax=Stentor coeruleus TaxID=5963 RepID=A0A1R2BDF8_9CILI|nr:hypothetical protein SteCoe_26201 [Stentor coeruleus]
MKVYIIAIFMLSLASASNLKTQVGQNCQSTGSITINDFDVGPWPPAANISSFVTVVFTVNQPNTTIGVVTYGTLNKYQQWTFQYQMVNQMYLQNSFETLQYILLWPNIAGNYITQVTFGSLNAPPKINACWVFSYTIG